MYVVILGGFIAPIIIIASMPFIPEAVKIAVGIGFAVGLLVYLIKNFALLMAMDVMLALLHHHRHARKRFVLPSAFSVSRVERKISGFGEQHEPIQFSPRPDTLRYKNKAKSMAYSSGTEKVISTYHVDVLDKSQYHSIVNSAKANAKALKNKKAHRLLDNTNKKTSKSSVTVILIYAKRLDEAFRGGLFDAVCKSIGNGLDEVTLPCVVDLEKRICTFDSMRIPYTGFQYPAKNRGINIIRKYLFHHRFTFADSPDMLDPIEDFDPEESLWRFWKAAKKDIRLTNKEGKKRFQKMAHRDIIFEDGYIYLKWQNCGIWVSAELNEELKSAEIDTIDSWDYPKSNQIAKDTTKEIESLINAYFAELGYTTKYILRK